MSQFFSSIFFVLSLIFVSTRLSATEYFVAVNGNDANNGLIASPWQTIQYGVNQLTPGDILNIRAGIYNEKINIDVSGTSSAYITIRAYQNENVVLDAVSFDDPIPIIWTDNAYLNIEGLHLSNNRAQYAAGLALQGVAHHINITGNKISNIQFDVDPNAPVNFNTNAVPLSIWADQAPDSIHHINIIGNEVFDNVSGYSENISAAGNFSHFLIADNIVHDNTNIGIDVTGNYGVAPIAAYDQGRYGVIKNNTVYNCNSPYSPAAGIYVDGGRDIIVENNLSFHNGYGGEIGCEENGSTSNVIFRNNIFYENEFAGMSLGGYDTNTTGTVISSSVLNNTFYNNDTGNNYHGPLLLSKSEDCEIENNIFYISDQNVFQYAYRTQTNLSMDYNLIYCPAGANAIEVSGNYNTTGIQNYYNASGHGANSVFGNPLFVNLTGDFHLTTNSPAIDAGNPSYVPETGEVDLDGEVRIAGGRIDCGNDEFGSTVDAHILTSSDCIEIYPNPFTDQLVIDGVFTNYEIKIYDVLGNVVADYTGSNNPLVIELNALGAGTYFVSIQHDVHPDLGVYKIIKQ